MAELRTLIAAGTASAARELEARLSALGHEVAAIASSGAAAIAAADTAAPELVLLDAALPGNMDSAAVAEAIRRRRAVPIVFMGTEAEEAHLQRRTAGAAPDFLIPPFSDRELRVVLELALCRHAGANAVHDLEGFFAASLDLLCFLDFSGYFKRLNPAWERTLGFTRDELMSRPFIDFVHPDDRERTLLQNADVRGGGQAAGFENRYLCKDGSYRWLLWNAVPQTADGVICSVAHDITTRKHAEAERAQLVRTLEASLAEVRKLQGILPICMYCNRIRDDEDYWQTVENYISRHTQTRFSHGICPSCMATEVEPHLTELDDG